MTLLNLFWAWFQIGLFSIGGGYAALPIIKNVIVDNNGWLTVAQFADLVVIDEMAPGPISLNSATFTGTLIAGFPGAVVSTVAVIAGPAILVTILAYFYFKYQDLPFIKTLLGVLRPAIVALITSAAISIVLLTFWGEDGFYLDLAGFNFIALALTALGVVILKKFKPNPLFVVLGCGLVGGIVYSIV
jgi:chromate transporter